MIPDVEAWVLSQNGHDNVIYADKVQSFCDVEARTLCMLDHESNVFNYAIDHCVAKYIWFLTPDVDLIYPETAYVLMETMERFPEIGVVCPNREGEPKNPNRNPFIWYLADNTAILYRRSVGARFDPEFLFCGWNDLDFGEEVRYLGSHVCIDPSISVNKHFTAYGSWSSFRRAYNARNRLLLEAKWYWIGRENWKGICRYNEICDPSVHIPSLFELSWWSENRLNRLADSVDHEHPQIYTRAGKQPGNIEWRLPE